MVQTLTCLDEIIVLTKAIIIVKDWITMLRKAGEARVNRKRRRYYLIVLLLPKIFTLACLPLSSTEYDTGHLMTVKSPSSAAPCRRCHGNSEILDRRSFRSDATSFLI